MFIGHYAIGFAAKKAAPRVSLGTLILASQFVDLLWPLFMLAGLERVKVAPGITAMTPLDFTHYPFTHSLFGVIVWAVVFGAVYYAFRREAFASLLLGGLVVSHWLLDFLTHRPDLQLFPWLETRVGLGLWDSVPATFIVETLMFAAGVYIYTRATSIRNNTGRYAWWVMVVFLFTIYLTNLFGPPPPSPDAIGVSGLALWLFVAWGYWIDRNRMSVPRSADRAGASSA
ncbi:MAG: hypothetical protein GXO82_01955 [Chlorobi bacterium]|nr:hypothetical protein [Chlorobiota bacterium]